MSWDDPKVVARVAQAYAAPDLAALRESQIDLLAPQAGWRIADIGCGPGAFAEALAARGARVTAVDSARAMLDAVAARDLGCEVVQADAAELPLASGSHDAACMVQVLEYVRDPVAALREAARVVRPGGVVLAADTDWDTMGFNVADRALGRRVMQAHADLKPDGWAGRRMRGWLSAAGLEPEARRVLVLDASEWGGDTFIAHNWPNMRSGVARSGAVPADDLARFEAQIEESAASGAFYWSVVRHAWRARVPG
jgi:SAM-dependent methyltransferase